MLCLENQITEPPWQKFTAFLSLLGTLKLTHSDPNLKVKISGYKDQEQILGLYESTFLKAVSSNSKKKSGTILILWAILKFAEMREMTVESFVNIGSLLSTKQALSGRRTLGLFSDPLPEVL